MTMLASDISRGVRLGRDGQHLYLAGVSWNFYRTMLAAVEGRNLRVTFFDGEIEVMAPHADHEGRKKHTATLIEFMTFQLMIERTSFGSTTLRRRQRQAGLEPDECYYFGENAAKVKGMKKYVHGKYPPPDLAIEVESSSQFIERIPIYARLGVRELWVDDGKQLKVLVLAGARYRVSEKSVLFPFLPMADFGRFVRKMQRQSENDVLREFQRWVMGLDAGRSAD